MAPSVNNNQPVTTATDNGNVDYSAAYTASNNPYSGFDHLRFTVTNAKQAASYYCTRLGFQHIAYRGLETGSREVSSHVVKQGDAVFVFESPIHPEAQREMALEIARRGDSVKDIAFTVKDCRAVYNKAIARGATSIKEPEEITDDDGTVIMATLSTYGDVHHTLIERRNYKGIFLPGYKDTLTALRYSDPLETLLPHVPLGYIDHVVGNQPDGQMNPIADFYEKAFDFHRFWSVDDKQVFTEYSALRSVVMADPAEKIKVPINEPAVGKKKSQIQEFVDFYGGAGVQHIAINTPDIITSVTHMKQRGCDFLTIPSNYYDTLRKNLEVHNKIAKRPITEDLDVLQKLNILVDYDENGYLLQIFTKPLEDRPTLFVEIIQRNNHNGFGAGNFKSLFESLELEQQLRGNLTDMEPTVSTATTA
ncbi:4-hydroxyphenylpyruvate dioxygenase [Mycotypha africana]|uniref:4-hydroxyphenylpyruvate dioxygenase n=1 Tax=Mycotypha africana TaxID=64632 RepID=UPI0023008B1A|nr:4-hydroxyphenylpyruvate dioxygenase [Mycotypha africana]KAI8984044.1 4-hydroxyphenylpyruvate dioxygenase [Mycotypha africana]